MPDDSQPDTTDGTAGTADPEPGEVPIAVWVGALLVVAIAAVWAVRRNSGDPPAGDTPDASEQPDPNP